MKNTPAALVFGASGSIGQSCFEALSNDCATYSLSHTENDLSLGAPYSSVVWAQGVNLTKEFVETTESDWNAVLEANLHFVRKSVKTLLKDGLTQSPASFVFIGSVWGDIARVNKSAYIVSKAALQGLTKSLAIDLAPFGIRVNSVLPGIVDNSMTRSNLSEDQIRRIELETPGGSLVSPNQIASMVKFLCSSDSNGVNGQSIAVDNGWSIARHI